MGVQASALGGGFGAAHQILAGHLANHLLVGFQKLDYQAEKGVPPEEGDIGVEGQSRSGSSGNS